MLCETTILLAVSHQISKTPRFIARHARSAYRKKIGTPSTTTAYGGAPFLRVPNGRIWAMEGTNIPMGASSCGASSSGSPNSALRCRSCRRFHYAAPSLKWDFFFFFSVMNKFVNFIVIFCSTLLYVRCDGFILLCVCSKVVQACKVKHYCVDRA